MEGIYSALSGKEFYYGSKDVEKYSIPRVIQAIQKQEKEHGISVLSGHEYEELKSICLRRNFWIHNCYFDMIFDIKTGGPKKEKDIQALHYDIKEAERIRELLYEKKMKLFKNECDLL